MKIKNKVENQDIAEDQVNSDEITLSVYFSWWQLSAG